MSSMILSAEQARAVVGCVPCDQWPGSTYPCKCAENGDAARFIPAASSDTWPVGEWIEVKHRIRPEQLSGAALNDGGYAVSVAYRLVGRVRLGEPVRVFPLQPCSRPKHVGPCIELMSWDHRPHELVLWLPDHDHYVDITRPHLDLWPDAWTPGSWAYPITERSTP